MKRLLIALFAFFICSHTPPVLAGSASASLQVTAVVDQSCVVSTSSLTFTTYSPFATTSDDSTGAVTIHCSVGTIANIGLDCGTACTASVPYMRNGSGGVAELLGVPKQYQDDSVGKHDRLVADYSSGAGHQLPGLHHLRTDPCLATRPARKLYRHGHGDCELLVRQAPGSGRAGTTPARLLRITYLFPI